LFTVPRALPVANRVACRKNRLLLGAQRHIANPEADRAHRNADDASDLPDRESLLGVQATSQLTLFRLHEHMFA